MKRYVVRFAAAFLLVTSTFVFTGCGGSGGGLATDSGTMTMEEFERLKAEEQQAISDSMATEFKTKK